jgi:hypothetical protein
VRGGVGVLDAAVGSDEEDAVARALEDPPEPVFADACFALRRGEARLALLARGDVPHDADHPLRRSRLVAKDAAAARHPPLLAARRDDTVLDLVRAPARECVLEGRQDERAIVRVQDGEVALVGPVEILGAHVEERGDPLRPAYRAGRRAPVPGPYGRDLERELVPPIFHHGGQSVAMGVAGASVTE